MQQLNLHSPSQQADGLTAEQAPAGMARTTKGTSGGVSEPNMVMQEGIRGMERPYVRQGIMYVRIRHFYCTLEEMFDPSLRGQPFVIGTGMGRPNEPGRVIDASPAAVRLGISPGMPLRRAHRLAPRTRFMPASYDRYLPMQQKLKERYRAYSRIIESLPYADAFIDLSGSEHPFESPVALAERLCAEIAELGLTAQIGVANGKTIAELAALMSRRDGRQGVLYIPPGREASFVQTLPLSMLLQLRSAGIASAANLPDLSGGPDTGGLHSSEIESKGETFDVVAMAELIAHLRDFGITTFAQVATLTEEGLIRRLGQLGGWVYQIACGIDTSLVVPDAPPPSQNARMRFQHEADADEVCAAIRKLADHLSARLIEQRLKGKSIALILWPGNTTRRETRKLTMHEAVENTEGAAALEETTGGQLMLQRHTDAADVIAHQGLMLFAHYHRSHYRYKQVQLRVGDIIATLPPYYPPPSLSRGRMTRQLG
jgi:nucleotidyltransferase/DNA polymerase involved in DNA repair